MLGEHRYNRRHKISVAQGRPQLGERYVNPPTAAWPLANVAFIRRIAFIRRPARDRYSDDLLLIAGKDHIADLNTCHVGPMEEPVPLPVLLGRPKIPTFLRTFIAIALEHPPECHCTPPRTQSHNDQRVGGRGLTVTAETIW